MNGALHTTRLILEPVKSAYAEEAWPQLNDERMWTYIAYAVYPAYQRKGYAREACEAIIAHLRDRRVKRILAEMDVQNEASYHLAESLGFKRIETRHAVQHGPFTTDEYVYELSLSH